MPRHLLLIIGLLATATPHTVYANDASFHGVGATVFASKEHRVAMKREKIVIRYDRKAKIGRRWVADCTFVFKNLTKEAITIQMGFPDWPLHEDSPRRGWAIEDFVAEVAGQPIKATHKTVDNADPSGKEQRSPLLPRRVALAYDAAYTWPVAFAPLAEVSVHNTYRFGGMHSNGPFDACVEKRRREGIFWRSIRRSKGERDLENGVCSTVQYIVTTGGTWAGPIALAEISIELPAQLWPHLFVPSTKATRVDGQWLHWTFRNFTPKKELEIAFNRPVPNEASDPPLFVSLAQAREWLKIARQNGFRRDAVLRLVEAYRALDGSGITARAAAYFSSDGMYREPPKVPTPLSKLNAVVKRLLEKQLVRFPE